MPEARKEIITIPATIDSHDFLSFALFILNERHSIML